MKKCILVVALVLMMALGMCAPTLAAAEPEPTPEPEYRLARAMRRSANGQSDLELVFSYDNGGWLPSAYEEQSTAGGNPIRTTLKYDEQGRLVSFVAPFDEYEFLYSYDEAGRLKTAEFETNYGLGESAEYTYEDDGTVTTEMTLKNPSGEGDTYSSDSMMMPGDGIVSTGDPEEYYSNLSSVPLLGMGYNMYSGMNGDFEVWLTDNAGGRIFTWCNLLHTESPELTYDDNGYLIKASDESGNSFEFVYEPVA